MHVRIRAAFAVCPEDDAMFLDRIGQHTPFGNGQGEWLFAGDMLSLAHRRQGDGHVPVVRCGIHDRVNISTGNYVTPVGIGATVGVLVVLVHRLLGLVQPPPIDIADGQYL